MTYQEEMDWIVTNPKRNNFIRNLCISQKGNTLVLFQFRRESTEKILMDLISEKAAEGRSVFFVHGGTDTEQREKHKSVDRERE